MFAEFTAPAACSRNNFGAHEQGQSPCILHGTELQTLVVPGTVHRAQDSPVLTLDMPAGQSRQEVEPGPGWYVETEQEVHLDAINGGPDTCHSAVKAPLSEEEYPSTMK